MRRRRRSKPRRPRRRRRQPTPSARNNAALIFTIGHSTHPIERFLELLGEHRIAVVADVRSFPSSKRWPQFNQVELSASLERANIEYRWIKRLGGRRSSKRADSPHTAWQLPAFRSYADYTESADFEDGLRELIQVATASRTAYMCSEGLWWRCHRRIISDNLVVRGWTVEHIMPTGKLSPHALAPFARVVDGRIIYDGPVTTESE
ncbi:MAG TPA: DUF488 domain-containing protein [Candidatus Limnocylindrales bacterium]|nr:DUF488 domain-containing protein [Candidatus Limnocylindrales bacterium]